MIRRHPRTAQLLFWGLVFATVVVALIPTSSLTRHLAGQVVLAMFAVGALAVGVEKLVVAHGPGDRSEKLEWRDLFRRYELNETKPRTLLAIEGWFGVVLGACGMAMVVFEIAFGL